MEMLDVSPDIHMLRSARHRNIGWGKALAELIDNAFDAKANQVKIESQSRVVRVIDDGKGVKDLAATVCQGKHIGSDDTQLGMYGVGLKDAWHWAGERMRVDTVHAGRRGTLVADSREMLAHGKWEIPSPVYTESSEPTGTTIELHLANSAPRRNAPSTRVFEELAWVFTPALRNGKRITQQEDFGEQSLKYVSLPDMVDVVDEIFEIHGKQVRLRAGIVVDGQTMAKGPFWIQYGHRNIAHNAIGCGSYSADRIGGIIELKKGDWHFTANKDDLADFKDELANQIYERIECLLKKADNLSEELANDQLHSELESQINNSLGSAQKTERERRPGKAGKKGGIRSVGTGRKRRKATRSDRNKTGSVEPRRKRGVYLAFSELDKATVGQFDDLSNRMTLNSKHPTVKRARELKDRAQLHMLALGLIANWAVMNYGQQRLLFESDDFGTAWGQVLASMNTEVSNAQAAV